MASVNNLRRFYLLKRLNALAIDDDVGLIWRGHQEEQESTPLPADFPSKTKLAAVGYTAVEDLDGADSAELLRWASLSKSEATTVLAAVAAL